VTAFYNGSLALRLGISQPEILWKSPKASEKDTTALHAIMCTPFIDGDYLYGVCSYGQLRCLKLATGERVWETLAATTPEQETRWANAFLVKHEGRFFLFNERGELTEGCIHNVFVVKQGVWSTPPVRCGLLPGVYRAKVLRENPEAREATLTIEDLAQADAIYLCNSVRGIYEVKLALQAAGQASG
jgi:hypothetical protein